MDDRELSAEGRAVYLLLTARDAGAAEAALDHLPTMILERFNAMSPQAYVADIHAPLVVLAHDQNDPVIPIGESRRLMATLAGRAGVRYTEFTMFRHLDPSAVKLPPAALARELVKFLRSVYPLFRQAVRP